MLLCSLLSVWNFALIEMFLHYTKCIKPFKYEAQTDLVKDPVRTAQ